MKHKLPYIVAIAILVGIAMLAVYSQSTSERPQLSFEMKPLRQSILPLEPIGLEFSIANLTSEKLKLHGVESLEWIKLEVRRPSGETFVPKQLSNLVRRKFASEKTYEPGQTKTWVEKLEFKLNNYFGEVGEYQLRAKYQSRDHLLTTAWVTLVVEQPEGEDLLAYEKLQTIPAMRDGVLTPGFDMSANRVAFIEQFPNTRYADYYRYKMAESLSDTDFGKAVEYYEAVISKPDFVFVEDAKRKFQELRQKKEIEEVRREREKRRTTN